MKTPRRNARIRPADVPADHGQQKYCDLSVHNLQSVGMTMFAGIRSSLFISESV
jgi:hypothetical protein